ncbi:hypothetical protein LDENG_00084330 [Lucifuga dentata]|nr:hypothetical protein LDENG_00084330 [Lucifuga dentata]
MSDKGTVSPKEEATEKRGRGRPRKQPQVKTSDEPSGSPTPKRGRGRPKGSRNKVASKGKKPAAAAASAGEKRRGRPKKEEKEEKASQESSEEEDHIDLRFTERFLWVTYIET